MGGPALPSRSRSRPKASTIAIAVRDVRASAKWYEEVLGLRRLHEEVWGDSPAVVGAGTTAIALFPTTGDDPKPRPDRNTIAMRHLAFRVSKLDLGRAREHLARRCIAINEQDHQIARSFYFADPDGHEIELTTYEV